MRVRKLSATGDMTFGSSSLDFLIDSPATVAQVVQTSLLLWLGEWYIDQTLGMPWAEGVLGKHSQLTADSTVQEYIRNVQGVTGISKYASVSDQSNRKYDAEAKIDTLFGPTDISVANDRNL